MKKSISSLASVMLLNAYTTQQTFQLLKKWLKRLQLLFSAALFKRKLKWNMILKKHILPLSQSSHFEEARKEWVLVDVEINHNWDHCPCGQNIKELCYLENQLNKNRTYVGNVCVNRFIGIDTGNLFAGFKTIRQSPIKI